jgi:hypothetical protein
MRFRAKSTSRIRLLLQPATPEAAIFWFRPSAFSTKAAYPKSAGGASPEHDQVIERNHGSTRGRPSQSQFAALHRLEPKRHQRPAGWRVLWKKGANAVEPWEAGSLADLAAKSPERQTLRGDRVGQTWINSRRGRRLPWCCGRRSCRRRGRGSSRLCLRARLCGRLPCRTRDWPRRRRLRLCRWWRRLCRRRG